MPDIAEQLDRAIGAAPSDGPALETTLASGRRALLRRRMAYGVGTAATALVIGGAAWAVSPGDSSPNGSGDTGFAERPGSDQFFTAGDDNAAAYHPVTGELLVRDGWSIVKRVEDPVTGPAPTDFAGRSIDDSVGLVLTAGEDPGQDQWVLAWWAARAPVVRVRPRRHGDLRHPHRPGAPRQS